MNWIKKKELNRLKVQLDTKRKKFEEMDINHAEVRAKLETKYKEFRDIEDKIKKAGCLHIRVQKL